MARKYTKRKVTRKFRPRTRKVTRKNRLAVVPRNFVNAGVGFPKRFMMTHKYVESVGMTSTTSSMANYFIRANSNFDPNFSSTGHQSALFDVLKLLYRHNTVIGSKCSFKITPSAVTSVPTRLCACLDDDGSLVPTGIDMVAEQTQAKRIKIIPAGDGKVVSYTLKWSPKKVFGGSILGNSQLKGSASTNPDEQSYFCIVAQAESAATISYNLYVEVTYITIWSELIDQTGS